VPGQETGSHSVFEAKWVPVRKAIKPAQIAWIYLRKKTRQNKN